MKNKQWFVFIWLLAIGTFAFPSLCFSEEPNPKIWEPLGYNSYYNKTMITKSPGVLLVWTYKTATGDSREKRMAEVKNYDPEKSAGYQSYHHVCFLWEIDCRNRQIMMKEFIDFDGMGKVLDRYRYDAGDWERIIPGSGGERLYQIACLPREKKSPQKKKQSNSVLKRPR